MPKQETIAGDLGQLTGLITRFEQLADQGRPTPRVIGRYQKRLMPLARPYVNSAGAQISAAGSALLYEMQALLNARDGKGDIADEYLSFARSLIGPDGQFVSVGANSWLKERAEAETGVTRAKRRLARRRVGALLAGLALAATALAWQPVADQATLMTASPAIVTLADQADMTRQGELLFLEQHPQLVSDSQMTADCGNSGAAGYTVNGCFLPAQHKIYLRQMSSDFSYLEVSTAAYEMLHVAYQDLSLTGSAPSLNGAIESSFTEVNNPNLNQQVAVFARTEPGARNDELFSLLATGHSASSLTPGLNGYISPYLADTSAVVADNARAAQTFQDLQGQMASIKTTIAADDEDTQTALADTNSWADSGHADEYYDNRAVYYSDLAAENAAINQYNSLLGQYDTLANDYNGSQPTAQIAAASN